jgi:hypothetical protein
MRTSTYSWPRQPTLSTRQRNRWKRYLKEQFLLSDGTSLKKLLGKWQHTNRNKWRYTQNNDRLHDHKLQLSATIQHQQRRSTQYYRWTSAQYQTYTDQHTPTTIQGATTSTTVTALHRQRAPPPSPATPPTQHATLLQYTKTLPSTQQRLLQTYQQHADDITLWRALRSKHTLTIASDDGLKSHQGTFGWKSVTQKDIVLFTGAGPVDGDTLSESSTRSELYGIAAPVLLLASLARFWGTKHRARYSWLCDSESALKQVRQLQYHKTCKRQQPNNADILSLLSDQLPALGRRLDGQWIKAHQDDDTPYEDLDRAARLNVDVDRLATWYRDHPTMPQSRKSTEHAPGTSVSISIGNTRLTGKYDSTIRHHVNGHQACTYIKTARDWDKATLNTIDWQNFGQHFKALPISKQVQRTKLIYRWQPVGTQPLRDALAKDPKLALCPTCQDTIETPDHPYLCDKYQSLRHRHYQTVTKITTRTPFHPALVILSTGIQQWLSSTPITIQDQVTTLPIFLQATVSKAINEQFDIGWNNALRGLATQYPMGNSGINLPNHPTLRARHRQWPRVRNHSRIPGLRRPQMNVNC